MLSSVLLLALAHTALAIPRAKELQFFDSFIYLSSTNPSPTPTLPHDAHNKHAALLRRASSTDASSPTSSSDLSPTLVDLFSMPTCSGLSSILSSGCVNPSAGSLPCPVIEIPCPPNITGTTCTTYDKSCYCSLVTPLECNWSCSSWFIWFQDEDWFANTCPDVQPVDFSALPDCASDCVESASTDYGCITGGRNCFCIHDSLFNCPNGCSSSDQAKVASWFANECNVTMDAATSVVQGGLPTASAVILKPSGKGKQLHWYEIFVIVVAASSFSALAIGALIWR